MLIKLDAPQLDLILQALQVQPYHLVAPLIQNLLAQANQTGVQDATHVGDNEPKAAGSAG